MLADIQCMTFMTRPVGASGCYKPKNQNSVVFRQSRNFFKNKRSVLSLQINTKGESKWGIINQVIKKYLGVSYNCVYRP